VFSYNETPIQEIKDHPAVDQAGLRLLIKREDLNHPHISGNKWWKLRYNLEALEQRGLRTILTFGGAYSNHIYATSAAAKEWNIKSIGIIRGERPEHLSHTLQFALKNGMELHYVTRAEYRNRSSLTILTEMKNRFGDFYMVPEGGSNGEAIRGCAEFAKKLSIIPFDHLFVSVGTGGTMAGLICGLNGARSVVGISALKGGGFLKSDIERMIYECIKDDPGNWSLLTDYHHGGYAKTTPELLSFIKEMRTVYNLPLDHVYTGKLLWAVIQEIKAGRFKRGEEILVLHSGGLQGSGITTP
jgi:1-aminocyclopropane-1-carboxylate deaminase